MRHEFYPVSPNSLLGSCLATVQNRDFYCCIRSKIYLWIGITEYDDCFIIQLYCLLILVSCLMTRITLCCLWARPVNKLTTYFNKTFSTKFHFFFFTLLLLFFSQRKGWWERKKIIFSMFNWREKQFWLRFYFLILFHTAFGQHSQIRKESQKRKLPTIKGSILYKAHPPNQNFFFFLLLSTSFSFFFFVGLCFRFYAHSFTRS